MVENLPAEQQEAQTVVSLHFPQVAFSRDFVHLVVHFQAPYYDELLYLDTHNDGLNLCYEDPIL